LVAPPRSKKQADVGLARVAGRYRILGAIAEGGAGEVFRAVDDATSREVALKRPTKDADGTRAEREAQRRIAVELALDVGTTTPGVAVAAEPVKVSERVTECTPIRAKGEETPRYFLLVDRPRATTTPASAFIAALARGLCAPDESGFTSIDGNIGRSSPLPRRLSRPPPG
jgi:hypothetical protein